MSKRKLTSICGKGKKQSKEKSQSSVPMDRTSAGLRDVLFDEIDSLRKGNSNPARARALAMLANTALKSVEVEIEFHKYVSDVQKHNGSAKLGYLELGRGPLGLSETDEEEPDNCGY